MRKTLLTVAALLLAASARAQSELETPAGLNYVIEELQSAAESSAKAVRSAPEAAKAEGQKQYDGTAAPRARASAVLPPVKVPAAVPAPQTGGAKGGNGIEYPSIDEGDQPAPPSPPEQLGDMIGKALATPQFQNSPKVLEMKRVLKVAARAGMGIGAGLVTLGIGVGIGAAAVTGAGIALAGAALVIGLGMILFGKKKG